VTHPATVTLIKPKVSNPRGLVDEHVRLKQRLMRLVTHIAVSLPCIWNATDLSYCDSASLHLVSFGEVGLEFQNWKCFPHYSKLHSYLPNLFVSEFCCMMSDKYVYCVSKNVYMPYLFIYLT